MTGYLVAAAEYWQISPVQEAHLMGAAVFWLQRGRAGPVTLHFILGYYHYSYRHLKNKPKSFTLRLRGDLREPQGEARL